MKFTLKPYDRVVGVCNPMEDSPGYWSISTSLNLLSGIQYNKFLPTKEAVALLNMLYLNKVDGNSYVNPTSRILKKVLLIMFGSGFPCKRLI